ncbi:hypothetical protein K1719_021758 [Acacia pycnantha]|nr:hypothetical protein K1719_021758 [Acacia pycnantha]
MALFRRFFYRKPPDRLLEISERVYGLSVNVNAFNLTSHFGGSGANTNKWKGKASSSQDKTSRGYRTTSSVGARKRGDHKKKKKSASSKIADCLSRIADMNDTKAQLSERMTSHAYDISISGVLNHLNQVEEVVAGEKFHTQCILLLMNNPPLREVYNSMKGMRKH